MPLDKDTAPSLSLYWLPFSARKLPRGWHRGRVAGWAWRDLFTPCSQIRLARLSPSPTNACLIKPQQSSQTVCRSVQLPWLLATHPDTSPRPPVLQFKALTSPLSSHRHEDCLAPTLQQQFLTLKVVIVAPLSPLSSAFSLRVEFGNKTSEDH